IVKEFENRGIELFRQEGRVGKTYTQNKAVERARGEIILFSDATTMYQPDVLEVVLPNFADSSVGCVAGRLVYVNKDEATVGKGTQSYWGYETFIKTSESAACSLIGVSGCLYAVRRSAYIPMYPEACSDFLICTVLYRQGLRSVYEPAAVCTEDTNTRTDKEFQMRVRIISQTFTDLWRNRDMLNPFKSGFFAVQLFSHKLLRYLVPIFLVTIFISTAVLANFSRMYAALLALQVGFYLLAALTYLLERRAIRSKLLSASLYFVLANLSSAVGLFKFLSGERYVRWEPNR
ncbi:MAG: glycosyltransferase, partial [Blastocatellia bacterium]|nr:glycosyltransferase [Blastocatellia bacterium]